MKAQYFKKNGREDSLKSLLLVLLLSMAGLMSAQSFTVGDLNYSVNADGVSVAVTGHVDGTAATGSLTIPETVSYDGNDYPVTIIDMHAFENCTGLTGDLIIPNSVTDIDIAAFRRCEGFTGDLVLPNSVITIWDEAFQWCSGLTSLTLPNALNGIGIAAFEGCGGINSFDIPNSLNYIGQGAFVGTGWYNDQPDGVLYKDNCCLGYKGTAPTGDFEIAEGTRLITAFNFTNCVDLTSLTFPNTLERINLFAFSRCTGLSSIETLALMPPALGELVFEDVDLSIPVTVPNGTLEAYQSAWGWSEFTNWVEAPAIAIDEIYVEGFTAPSWGMHPDFDVTVPDGAPYTVDEVTWFYDNDEMAWEDVFSDEEGTYYMLVYLTPEEGYEFDPDATVFFNGDDSINDAAYNDILSDGTFKAYTIDFWVTPPASNIISEIYVKDFIAPMWGEHPNFDVTVPTGAHYAIDEVIWLYNGNEMSEGDVFNDEGGTYYMLVYLIPEEAYVFDPNATVYFNGDASINDVAYNDILSDGTFKAYTIDYYVISPTPSTYTVTATANPSAWGMVRGGGAFLSGETCTLTATANSGYQFLNWTKNGAEVSNNATYTFIVTESATYTANFIQSQTQTYTLTVSCDPTMGAVSGNGTYVAGTEVTVEAFPYKDYVFDHWNDGNSDNPRTITINSNMTLVAMFKGTGVDENGTVLLSVYPNPVRENLRFEGLEHNVTVEIYNSLGMMVKTFIVTANEEINVGDLPSGFYVVRCGRQTIRFVKE